MNDPAASGRGIIRRYPFLLPPHPNPLPPGERELYGNPAASSGVLKNNKGGMGVKSPLDMVEQGEFRGNES